MKINEFVIPSDIKPGEDHDIYDNNFDEILKFIEQNCSEYLKVVKQANRFLFRGISNEQKPIIIGNPRLDRRPIDVPYISDNETNRYTDSQNWCDAYLKLAGIKALRSQNIFCANNKYDASSWGTICNFSI